MAGSRSLMLLSGVCLILLAAAAGVLRSLGNPITEEIPAIWFWMALFVALVFAVTLLMFIPPSRRNEKRVTLNPPESKDKLARPGTSRPSRADLPVTRIAKKPAGTTPKRHASSQEDPSGPAPERNKQDPPGIKRLDTGAPAPSSTQPGAFDDHPQDTSPDPSSGETDVQGAGPHNPENQNPAPSRNTTGGRSDPRSVAVHNERNELHGARGGQDPVREREPMRASGHPNDAMRDGSMGQPPGDLPPSLREARSSSSHDGPVTGGGGAWAQSRLQFEDRSPAPPSLRRSGEHTHRAPEAQEQADPPPQEEAHQRDERRREELESRLHVLEQRANSAKVSLGLGRISNAGYRQYVKEVERERMLIEGELIALNEG